MARVCTEKKCIKSIALYFYSPRSLRARSKGFEGPYSAENTNENCYPMTRAAFSSIQTLRVQLCMWGCGSEQNDAFQNMLCIINMFSIT